VGFHWGPSQQHNRVLACTVHLEVLRGSISPSTATGATPRGRQAGAPLTANIALLADTMEVGKAFSTFLSNQTQGRSSLMSG